MGDEEEAEENRRIENRNGMAQQEETEVAGESSEATRSQWLDSSQGHLKSAPHRFVGRQARSGEITSDL